ncbi:hypothetical protein PILCRDRAFT_4403 [Piloderma croceum F 1598]|uniref:Uncharacterized protein n=1 Tax=Piloderma croceum (strain F 1598) TaxID=765440 RepID=A0A0C3CC17_PILCF|nr:hypothetical protein PILCRDRAFT_4403 [Piloderma croceum F 1598]
MVTDSISTPEDNIPVDKMIFYPRPSSDMEMRLASGKSSMSTLQNAAGLNDEEFKLLKDVLVKTAREHLDLRKKVEDQDEDQWQHFVNELWESKIGHMLDNYEQQWPMMVYMHKYLAHGRRKQKADLNVDNLATDEESMPEAVVHADADAKRGSSYLVSDDDGLPLSDTKSVTTPAQASVYMLGSAKGKENVPLDEGHRVEAQQSNIVQALKRSRRRWTPIVEIPVRRKTIKNTSCLSSASSSAQPIRQTQEREPSPTAPSASQTVAYAPVKAFLESCHPSLEQLLPSFIDADIKDDSRLMALVLSPQRDRLLFLEKEVRGMTKSQALAFDENCEMQSRYSA